MKRNILDIRLIIRNLQLFFLVIIAISLPYLRILNTLSIIFFIISIFPDWQWKNLKSKKQYVLLFILLFFVQALSFFYSQNINGAITSLVKYLPILIFPLFVPHVKLHRKKIKLILQCFIFSCLFGSIVSFGTAGYRNFLSNRLTLLSSEYFNTFMVDILSISHVYFGIFVSFSCLIIIYYLLMEKINFKIFLPTLAFLVIFLLTLSAKMAILSLISGTIFLLTFIAIFEHRTVPLLFSIIAMAIIISFAYTSFPAFRQRFSLLFNSENYLVGDNQWNSIASRVSILSCTKEVIKDNLFFGVGIGDGSTHLDNCFQKKGFVSLLGMNAHNQYLQYLINIGIFGLIIFVINLIFPLVGSINNKFFIYSLFLIIIASSSLTESILATNKGVVFYSFFNSIFAFYSLERRN